MARKPKYETPLTAYARKTLKQSKGEQKSTRKLANRALKAAGRAAHSGSSKGTITARERKAVKLLGRSARSSTTRGEALGVMKIARKKARKS